MNKVWAEVCDLVCAIREKCDPRPIPPVENDEFMGWLKEQKQESEKAIDKHRLRRRSIDDNWKGRRYE